jgi:hypothetical protein
MNKLWWMFMPGTKIKVKWPVGWTDSVEAGGGGTIQIESADPNDHYRPELENLVGKQGLNWDWTLMDDDISTNKLTIKFRRGKEHLASYFALKWG